MPLSLLSVVVRIRIRINNTNQTRALEQFAFLSKQEVRAYQFTLVAVPNAALGAHLPVGRGPRDSSLIGEGKQF